MINRESAIELAQKWFRDSSSLGSHMATAAVDETKVIETSFAWILPWDDRRCLAGDTRWAVAGHSPVVVLKSDGAVMWLPTLTAGEKIRWNSGGFHGAIEHRILKLAEQLGVSAGH